MYSCITCDRSPSRVPNRNPMCPDLAPRDSSRWHNHDACEPTLRNRGCPVTLYRCISCLLPEACFKQYPCLYTRVLAGPIYVMHIATPIDVALLSLYSDMSYCVQLYALTLIQLYAVYRFITSCAPFVHMWSVAHAITVGAWRDWRQHPVRHALCWLRVLYTHDAHRPCRMCVCWLSAVSCMAVSVQSSSASVQLQPPGLGVATPESGHAALMQSWESRDL